MNYDTYFLVFASLKMYLNAYLNMRSFNIMPWSQRTCFSIINLNNIHGFNILRYILWRFSKKPSVPSWHTFPCVCPWSCSLPQFWNFVTKQKLKCTKKSNDHFMQWSFDDSNSNGWKTHHTLKNSMVRNFWDIPKLMDYENAICYISLSQNFHPLRLF